MVQIQSDGTPLSYSATATSSGDWLRLGTNTGTTPGILSASVDPGRLEPGTYEGFITIFAQGALNNPQLLRVNLTVLVGHTLSVAPTSLNFSHRLGTALPLPQQLVVGTNSSPLDFTAVVSSNGNWLSVAPSSGVTPATIQVAVNPTGLAAGSYVGTILVTAPGTINGSMTVTVTLTVSPVQTLIVSTNPVVFSFESSSSLPFAQTLIVGSNVPAIGFTVAPLSGASWLSVTPGAATAPATIEIRANPAGLAAGNYSSSIVITSFGVSNSPVVVPVTMAITSNQPVTSVGGIVNSASAPSTQIAPGSLFSIYGIRLATETVAPSGIPLPTTAGGVKVEVNGVAAPLFYVSEGQINAQMPYEIEVGNATVVVTTNGVAGKATVIPIQASAPGIFLNPNSTRALVQNEDYSLNGATNPAKVGTYITGYLTGQGVLDNPVPTGMSAPLAPLSIPQAPVSVSIGGVPAKLYFAGLTPGLIGVFQINVQIPELPAGEHPLQVKVGSSNSNAATIIVGR
ncbi:BACON domain-containing protein [Bryobacter aggregatus]|uniref:BACON domain-containing protein n=1 Tax=Bryobacter aggregatus TaxID=360054 RepID=UPI0012BAD7E4|nr:hypothetical protein [Bryobacter aggregatus]